MAETNDKIPQFGKQKKGIVYRERPSVYGIAYNAKGEILVARARGKLVLPGGGVDEGETAENALLREILEETGWRVDIIDEVCRANEYMVSKRKNRATNKLAQFFRIEAIDQIHDPLDDDHEPLWIPRKRALKELRQDFFRWAVERIPLETTDL